MNRLLLIIFLIFSNKMGISQSSAYHPFPLDGSEWRTDYFDILCTSNIYSLCSSYSYYPEGDTIINLLEYTKFYTDLIQYEYAISDTHLYIGALREDTFNKKVYFFHINQQSEYLLFDFNLGLGDTSLGGFTEGAVVTSVDSILVGSEFHRRFNFYNSVPYPIFLIEGIGTNGGIFSGVYDGYGEEKKDVLKCFKLNNITLLEDSTSSLTTCELFTNHSPIIKQETKLSILPNPISVNEQLRLISNSNSETFVTFFEIDGRTIFSTTFKKELSIPILTSLFNRGIYLIRFDTGDSTFSWFKLIVQ